MRRRVEAMLLCLALCAGAAGAQGPAADATRGSELERLRPTGPITVSADRAEWVQGGPMRYSGNVVLSSDTLKLDGDTLELRQLEGGEFEARIAGKPAHLDHAGQAGAEGAAAQPVKAQARELFYDSKSGIVQLSGDAQLARGGDEINGERIRYEVAARRIQADGGDNGQVRIVIQPPPKDGGSR